MKRPEVLLRVLLITAVLVSSAASQRKPVTALTGETELIGGAGTNIAWTEAEYHARVKQLAGSPVFVLMTKKPDGLSPRARFGINFVFEGRNRSWALDGDDASGYIFYADINANGDLGDDPGRRFELVDGKYSLRLRLLAKSEDGAETYPVIMKIVIDRAAPPGKDDKQLALLIYDRTRRSGQFLFESDGRPLPFVITGTNGIYNWDYDWIYFDMDRDGTFDPKVEGFQISERYVNIGDKTYEFAVDRYGRSVTMTPLAEKRPPRAILLAGYPAPEFDFVDLQGVSRRLMDYRGKVVLLDFWGTWCGPCVASVPGLVAVYEKYHAKGFEIIGIAAEDKREDLLAFTAEKRMNWPQTIESDNGPLATLYRITGFPSYFLIGADGRIVVAAPGGEKIDIAGELAKLLPDKGPL
jgi:thiol-disulfide isomerase/thioredoxin